MLLLIWLAWGEAALGAPTVVPTIGPSFSPTYGSNQSSGGSVTDIATSVASIFLLGGLIYYCYKRNKAQHAGQQAPSAEAKDASARATSNQDHIPSANPLHTPWAQDKATLSPRSVLQQLFSIQGINVDPKEVNERLSAIITALKRSGWQPGRANGVDKYDCFISYRVAADKGVAKELYLMLKANTPPIHAFLDEFCLKSGGDWKKDFLTALHNSGAFVALVSRKALEPLRNFERNHSADSVLLEYEVALRIRNDRGNENFVVPVLLGAYEQGPEVLSKFSDFSPHLYSPTLASVRAHPV